MENEEFYTILTNVGKAKIANAISLNTQIDIVKFHVGDGDGEYYNPIEEQTELKNKVWECSVNSVRVDENNPNWIVLEVVVPGNVGGFTIREVGAFDSEDNLIAIGKFPQTYKPNPTDGSLKELILKMVLEVSNTSCVVLKVDPTVILATKKDIDELSNKIDKLEDRLDKLKLVDTKVEFTDSEDKFGFGKKTHINEALMKLKDDLDKAFQIGADVKQRVMSAINSKHSVPDVTINDIWDTYIQRIIDIKEGRGDAQTSHVLQGKTFTNHTGNLLTGTIPNRGGGQTITPGTGNKTLYSGYYSGNITILGEPNLNPNNILEGISIFNVNGSIPNRGQGPTIIPTTSDKNILRGYYNSDIIVKGDANLRPENIRKGVRIFGIDGTCEGGVEVNPGDGLKRSFGQLRYGNTLTIPRFKPWQRIEVIISNSRGSIDSATVTNDNAELQFAIGYTEEIVKVYGSWNEYSVVLEHKMNDFDSEVINVECIFYF